MANRNTTGRTAANMGVAGALAFIVTAMVLPQVGMEVPQGAEAAFTALFGGLMQYIRNIRE